MDLYLNVVFGGSVGILKLSRGFMITSFKNVTLHWNYFIALEDDLATLSRYIEFCDENYSVFSIELAHLLLAAASEVDVLAKSVCKVVAPSAKAENIGDYRMVLSNSANTPAGLEPIAHLKIYVPRYGLNFTPWDNWQGNASPNWWTSYNHVKHERDKYFREATLQHVLNAMGALLILNLYHYRLEKQRDVKVHVDVRDVTKVLEPDSSFLRFSENWYESTLAV